TLVKGKNIFDSFDFISGNILFVLTAFFCCIYVGWILGKEQSIKELSNEGKLKSVGFKIWFYYIKFIIPLIILTIFVYGVTN
ncbi:TPA: sodium-dependent transporter, partial [Campylobacter coli]|nr:sodium-dependent transporter [Campylobacter coli]